MGEKESIYMLAFAFGSVFTTPKTMPEIFENPKSCNNHRTYWICVSGKLGQENHMFLCCHRFQKAPFSKCFPSTLKRKAGVFKFLRFEERFPKAPFS